MHGRKREDVMMKMWKSNPHMRCPTSMSIIGGMGI
jgi:hypothetical protein